MTRRDTLLFARSMESVSVSAPIPEGDGDKDAEMDGDRDVDMDGDRDVLRDDSGGKDGEMDVARDKDAEMDGSEGVDGMEMEDVLTSSCPPPLTPPPPPPPSASLSPVPPPSTLPPGRVDEEHDWWIDRLLEVTTSSAFAWRGQANMQITPQVLHLVAFYFIELYSYLTEDEAGQII